MHFGFTIIFRRESHSPNLDTEFPQNSLSYNCPDGSGIFDFYYNKNERFAADKLFVETENYILGIDGVILNLKQLKNNYNITEWQQLFIHLYEKHKNHLGKSIIGEYHGFVFDKRIQKLFVFVNPTASKPFFHFNKKDLAIVSPSLFTISGFLKKHQEPVKLDLRSAYCMLTSGGMYDNSTLIKDVTRMEAGSFLIWQDKNRNSEKYYDLTKIEIENKPKSFFIKKMEDLFTNAVALEYQKDRDYNLPHLATLSGGMDSRLNIYIAKKMGFDSYNLCFSQSGYEDERTAKKIAKSLGHDYTFVPLDGGDYLLELDENMDLFQGQIFYPSSAHFHYALKKVETSKYGLIHTGLLGSAVLGGYLTQPRAIAPDPTSKLDSSKLLHRIADDLKLLGKKYPTEETYKLHQRNFNLIMSGAYMAEKFNYLTSPFMHAEFLSFCLSIPPKYKYYHQIFIQWFNQYHPEVTKFRWETTGMKPTWSKQRYLSRYTKKLNALWHQYTGRSHQLTMTPIDHWYQNNVKLSDFIETFYNQKKDLLSKNPTLSQDVNMLFETGNTFEKTLVMTLLSAIEKLKLEI